MKLATGSPDVNPCFVKVPEDMLDRLNHYTAQRVYQALVECARKGWSDPPIRWIAARVKRSYMQVTRGLKILRDAGYIRWIRRRISRTRCLTNRYEVISHTDVREKTKSRDVKAEAPRAVAQLNRLRNQLAHARSVARGFQIRLGQAWRTKSADLMSVNVGVWKEPGMPPEEVERLRRKHGI
jgi:hypothetical protein